MKDLEKLRKILDEAGWELLNLKAEENDKYIVIAKPKDIWEGVEFAEITSFIEGSIRKIERVSSDFLHFTIGSHARKEICQPSTKKEYVKQLEKEALEKYGVIKEGDEFKIDTGDAKALLTANNKTPFYDSEHDCLNIRGIILYSKGLWVAKRLEKIEVKAEGGNIPNGSFAFLFNETAREKLTEKGYWNACEFLAKQLEDYLNEK